MGRAPCCEKVGLKRGRWTAEEDEILRKYINANGEGSWRSLPKNAGLLRCGKSCRLRWINYLRSDLKRGNITGEEEDIILKLHATLGNRWSLIAGQLPGRTDNEIKNYWNSHLSRKISSYGAGNQILNSQMTTITKAEAADVAGIATPKRRGGRTSRAAMKKNRGVVPTAAGAYNIIIAPLKNISRHNLLPVLNNDNDSSSSSNNNNNKLNYRKEDGYNNDRTKKKKKTNNNNNNVVARSTIQTLTAMKGSVVTTATTTTALKGDHQLAASNNYNMNTSPNYEPHIGSSLILTSPNYSNNNNNNNGGGGGHPVTTNQGLTDAVEHQTKTTSTTTNHQDDMLCFDHDLMVSPAGLILTSTEGEVINKHSTKNNMTATSTSVDHESSCCEQRSTLNSTTSTNTANSSTTAASYLHQQQQDHTSNTCCWFDIGDQGSINNTGCFVDDSLLMWDNINVGGGGGGVGGHDETKDILSWLWDTSSTHDIDHHHMDPPADNTTTTESPTAASMDTTAITNTQDFGDHLERRQQALVAWLLS